MKERDSANEKVFKVIYILNLLPMLGEYITVDPTTGQNELVNEGESIISLCEATEELSIFNTSTMEELIKFKWETYA